MVNKEIVHITGSQYLVQGVRELGQLSKGGLSQVYKLRYGDGLKIAISYLPSPIYLLHTSIPYLFYTSSIHPPPLFIFYTFYLLRLTWAGQVAVRVTHSAGEGLTEPIETNNHTKHS